MKNDNKKTPKNPKNFYCKKCDFLSSNKKDFNRHELTRKHNFSPKQQKKTPTVDFGCKFCTKEYKYASGLSRHKKKCKKDPSNVVEKMVKLPKSYHRVTETTKSDENFSLRHLLIQQIKQQNETIALLKESIDTNSKIIPKTDMSKSMRNSAGSISTLINITKYSNEIELLLSDSRPNMITVSDETVENASEFALEAQLEEFLVENWESTELGEKFDIFEVDGETVGQQYYTDVGEIDILAISKDKKSLLVIGLKRGRASDRVVGQCLRYIGFVKSELAESNQTVHGMIIAHEEDLKIKRALSVTPDIEFYTYKIDFQLQKSSELL